MKVLVTGGCGFIGSNTIPALLSEGLDVRVLQHIREFKLPDEHVGKGTTEIFQGDIRSWKDCERMVEGCDAVLHLAGVVSVPASVADPMRDMEVNVQGGMNVLEAAKKACIRRFVFASSASVYGEASSHPHSEEERICPRSPYAAAKASFEQYLKAYAHCYDIECRVLRYFNVYGPGQDLTSSYSGVLTRYLGAIESDTPFTIFGDGTQTRDFIYVKDIARANVRALTERQSRKFECMNIATGKSISLLDVKHLMIEIMGHDLQLNHGPERSGDIRHSRAQVDAAKKFIDFTTAYSFEKGIQDWFGKRKTAV